MIRFTHAAPHLFSSDVPRAREFYERVLGFSLDYSDGEPPHYAVVRRDEVYVHLSHVGPHGAPQPHGAAFIAISGVQSLWAQVAGHGDCVVAPLTDEDYGSGVRFAAFTIRDPDGNVVRIGEPRPPAAG
jgi:predicted enzyme related to lactoylglutathione lyase